MAETSAAGASTAAAGTEQRFKIITLHGPIFIYGTKGRFDQGHLYHSGVQGIEPGSPAPQAGTLHYLKSYSIYS